MNISVESVEAKNVEEEILKLKEKGCRIIVENYQTKLHLKLIDFICLKLYVKNVVMHRGLK
ncbi:hypothetical protein LCGC14_0441840 [marine sediment metagenome]|uniref:Uncharacterized protein n=1 Tax=marine sediment metagenome TaxID=412755 RepID=A0A0F9SK22_9ZZZZ